MMGADIPRDTSEMARLLGRSPRTDQGHRTVKGVAAASTPQVPTISSLRITGARHLAAPPGHPTEWRGGDEGAASRPLWHGLPRPA
jgi:hypothetical protein